MRHTGRFRKRNRRATPPGSPGNPDPVTEPGLAARSCRHAQPARRVPTVLVSVTTLGSRAGDAAGAAGAVLGYLEGRATGRRGPERGGPKAPAPPDVPEASGPAAYYADSVEGPGTWTGHGVGGVTMEGTVAAAELRRLLLAQDPRTGTPLREITTRVASSPARMGLSLTTAEAATVAGVSPRYLRRVLAESETAEATRARAHTTGSRAPPATSDLPGDRRKRDRRSRAPTGPDHRRRIGDLVQRHRAGGGRQRQPAPPRRQGAPIPTESPTSRWPSAPEVFAAIDVWWRSPALTADMCQLRRETSSGRLRDHYPEGCRRLWHSCSGPIAASESSLGSASWEGNIDAMSGHRWWSPPSQPSALATGEGDCMNHPEPGCYSGSSSGGALVRSFRQLASGTWAGVVVFRKSSSTARNRSASRQGRKCPAPSRISRRAPGMASAAW